MTDPMELWRPTAESVAAATMSRYLDQLAARGLHFSDYRSLWTWSVEQLPTFWESIWEFFGLDQTTSYDAVLADPTMPGAEWFTGARLNFAQRCLAAGVDDEVAIVGVTEAGSRVEYTYRELRQQVARVAAHLRSAGVGRGDHVAGYLPNVPEAVVALLATAAVGAVWTSAAPEFGTPSVLARLEQVAPTAMFVADGYHFGGKVHDRRAEVAEILAQLPSVRQVVMVPVIGSSDSISPADPPAVPTKAWSDVVAHPAEPLYADTAFDDPLWVLWSSGTTGSPKGIVQGHGGITVELLKALALGCDIHSDDRFLFVSSTGWMVWNFLVGGLLLGTTIVCYDGSPTYPDLNGVWALAQDTRATVVGVGAAYLIAGHRADERPADRFDLSHVRAVLQTGSTLPDEAWRWTCQHAVPGVWLQSISGGTDVCSALAGASPLLPVVVGRICAPALGVDLHAWDQDGHDVVGELGELVVTSPMPSMPLGFVNDPTGTKYHDSYFSTYPGVWRHGDWVSIAADQTITVAGRSDATLNRMGVRLGSAEIYAVLDNVPEVADSLVVGLERPGGDYHLPLFVVIDPGNRPLDDNLRDKINAEIRGQLSPRHVPDVIIEVAAVPRTLTGKRLEVPVKRILQGESVAHIQPGAITHPEMLVWFEHHAREWG